MAFFLAFVAFAADFSVNITADGAESLTLADASTSFNVSVSSVGAVSCELTSPALSGVSMSASMDIDPGNPWYPMEGGSTTFTVVCDDGTGITLSDSVTVSLDAVPAPVPVTDIKANGLDGPIAIKNGDSATLTWTTTNYPKECVASNSWSGLKNPAGGSEATGPLFGPASFTYNLTCKNSAGSSSDSVIVNVIQTPENDLFNILKFDDNGNAVLKGALQQNSEPQPTTGNAFIIIKDKSGGNAAVLDFTKGDIMIKGTLHQNQSTLAPPSYDRGLIIKDSNGNVISYIDDSGDFYLKGTLTYGK